MKNTGVRIGIGWAVVAVLLVAVWLGGTVLAQREGPGPGRPGGPMQPQGPPVIMKAGSAGVFVLIGNTLTKYDTALAEKRSLKLVDQSGAPDPQGPMPPKPTIMLLTPGANEKVLVLIGERFFSVDAGSLTVTARATLPPLPAPPPPGDGGNPPGDQMVPGGPGRPPMGPPMPVGLELQGDVLYMLRGPQVLGVNIQDGKIVGPTDLPKPPLPGEGK